MRVELLHPPAMYYALVHNRVPVVHHLRLENLGDAAVESVDVTLELAGPDGPLAEPWTRSAVTVPADGVVSWDDFREFAPDASVLKSADEAFPVTYRVAVLTGDGADLELSVPSRMLAHNEWLSAPALYESISAFVQPNTAAVQQVLRAAGALLLRETGSSSLQGYQAGPKRAVQIGAALYEALREHAITYVGMPASFEDTGQKVRTTSEVLRDRVGNCIDLSVTYAACLEAAGLHPLIWIVRGHAFAGFFLNEERLPESVSLEPSQMINVVESAKAVAVELTGIGPGADSVDFAGAVRLGRAHLRGPRDLYGMVDVHLAHRSDIRPMPSADAVVPEAVEEVPPSVTQSRLALPDELIASGVLDEEENLEQQATTSDAPPRIGAWRRALLDLSLRNPLLKLPKRGKGLDLHIPAGSLKDLDDLVHTGKPLNIVAQDVLGGVHELQGVRRAQELPDEIVANELVADRRVYASVTQARYVDRMRELQRAARTVEQETGSNYLYLTLGSMVHPTPTGEAHAPLFVLPVRIEGGTGRRPYTVVVDGDELAAPNHCLVQWLRQKHGVEIPVLQNPILDGAGIDIGASLRAIRQGLVDNNLNFRIDETASLRLLEFSTFQMWRDLTQHWESFMQNPLVRHLVENPGQPMGGTAPVDVDIDETELLLPIAADGSQMRAIALAEQGHSFVLEGPPGTGKSQTIINLIAHAMTSGKTVLFVAEKQAALDVVKRRLAALGLDTFCLDVHGRKQSQRSITQQLKAAMERQVPADPHEWSALTAKFRSRVTELLEYPEQLHGTNGAGFSVWSGYQAKLAYGDGPAAPVPPGYFSLPEEQRRAVEAAARDLPSATHSARLRPHHPWAISGLRSVDGLASQAFLAAAQELEGVRQAFDRLPEMLRHRVSALPHPLQLGQVIEAARLARSGRLPDANRTAAATRPRWDDVVQTAVRAIALFQQQHQDALATFRPEFFVHPAFDSLQTQAAEAGRGLFGKKKRRVALVSALREHLTQDGELDETTVLAKLQAAFQARQAAAEIAHNTRAVPGLLLPPSWLPTRPDAAAVVQAEHRALQVSREARHRLPEVWEALSGLGAHAPTEELERFVGAWQRWLQVVGTADEEFSRWAADSGWAAAWARDGQVWVTDLGRGLVAIQRWGVVLAHTDVLNNAGLTEFREKILAGEAQSAEIEMAVLRGIARSAVDERLRTSALEYFDSTTHNQHVGDYLEFGEKIRDRVPEQIAAGLVHAAQRDSAFQDRAGKLVRRLGARNDRLSFREAAVQYPDVISRLTPCLLMSPASVAAFLEPGGIDFDIVVFDEASQIRVAQAIGAMGRGKSVVVVGDSKQMPPTSVMQASNTDQPEDSTVPEDLDSILSECVESGLPRELLTWHYRSTDESLIAFSNRHYYDGKLASLPAPGGDESAGIVWRRVDGHFESGGSRTNVVEARAIVAEISRILADPRTADRSIGVVTFNIHQRDLVLNLLESSDDRNIQQALIRGDNEELFVKNLENVQGDERDVILFSLAFSPDPKTGRVRLQLGPLINAGGERRLNVAVTRARAQVIVFSSFDPEHIDLTATKSVGIHHLRAYLEFAARGLHSSGDLTGPRPNIDRITEEIAAAIRARGHEVETHYGLSNFTVDIAVREPGHRSWQVAVVLDGPEWAARPTLADRDAAPRLLTDLMNWPDMVRVWLPQWMTDRDGVLDGIDRAVAAVSVQDEPTPVEESPVLDGEWPTQAEKTTTIEVVPTIEVEEDRPILRDVVVIPETAETDPGTAVEEFVPFEPVPVGTREQLDELAHDKSVQLLVRECMDKVIACEGPIEIDRLMKLVSKCFGLQRLSADRNQLLQRYLPRRYHVTGGFNTKFVWPDHRDPATWPGFRPNSKQNGRQFDEISPEEIVNAMCHACDTGRANDTKQLFRTTRELLGFGKTTKSMEHRFGRAMTDGAAEGRLPQLAD
ncbi:DUF4011 domain-containing protein [Saccharopolyspora phatthalungensis]|uniref:DUF4011 domain-containing protein n=1 Tax=Saccharopolyspora phatthalungensis TaxID=664693 RepID=UPI001FE50AB3|nr:DUF4011 domain-containing protein [Saccharopolyspora phatthalungensis]